MLTADVLLWLLLMNGIVFFVSISRIKKHIESISDKAMGRAERNKRIVNMYLEGFSIDEIFKESGFSSRSSVFRILNEANVQLDRGRWKGPLGPRKKKED